MSLMFLRSCSALTFGDFWGERLGGKVGAVDDVGYEVGAVGGVVAVEGAVVACALAVGSVRVSEASRVRTVRRRQGTHIVASLRSPLSYLSCKLVTCSM